MEDGEGVAQLGAVETDLPATTLHHEPVHGFWLCETVCSPLA